MFNIFKKKFNIKSPVDGKIIELEKVPDEVFSQKMVGDGFAIEPTGSIISAPADGNLKMIFQTNHAFAIECTNGIQLLIHIGLDTVNLNGSGFKRLIEPGESVKTGQPIVEIDNKTIREKGYSLITMVVITNMEEIKEFEKNNLNIVKAGEETVITYRT